MSKSLSTRRDRSSLRTAALVWTSIHAPVIAALMARSRAVAQSPDSFIRSRGLLLKHLRAHGRSLQPGRTPLGDMQPWIQFAARDALVARLPPTPSVLEFGSGGSTLFWLCLGASVISVEHDDAWARDVREEVSRSFGEGARFEQRVVPPDPLPQDAPISDLTAMSTDEAYSGMTFDRYVRAAGDLRPHSIDLLLVDGRARSATLLANADTVKPGGILILDNSERSEYQNAMRALEARGWNWRHYEGPFPYLTHFSRTSIANRSCFATSAP